MATSPVFDWVCEALEASSSFDTLEARGTIRIALKDAGLDPRDVEAQQMQVLLELVLADELTSRGVENADEVCRGLVVGLKAQSFAAGSSESPDAVFARLGGSR